MGHALSIPRMESPLDSTALIRATLSLGRTSRGGKADQGLTTWLQKRWSCAHVQSVSSVRFGLRQVLQSLGVGQGDEVLCSPITVHPVVDVVRILGARIVFYDIHTSDFSPNLVDVEKRITARTKAMLTTHLWGIPNRMDELMAFSRTRGIALVEDGSQCFNGAFAGRAVGTYGIAGLFSLSLTKNITAVRGGVMVTDDGSLARSMSAAVDSLPSPKRSRLATWLLAEWLLFLGTRRPVHHFVTGPLLAFLRRLGKEDRFNFQELPPSSGADVFPRALLFAPCEMQMKTALRLCADTEAHEERRRDIANEYAAALSGIPQLRLPQPHPEAKPVYWMYAVGVKKPWDLKAALWDGHRVDTSLPSTSACHAMRYFRAARVALPGAEEVWSRALYLPMYPSLPQRDVDRVIDGVREYFGYGRGGEY